MPLPPNVTINDWIKDFVHSKNPKFAGLDVDARRRMAMAAFYGKKEKETNEAVILEIAKKVKKPKKEQEPKQGTEEHDAKYKEVDHNYPYRADESVELTEKIHPKENWHLNDPDKLMAHIYWLHGRVPPKDLKIKEVAYHGLVKQLHALNPAPNKRALDRHMNHFKKQATKALTVDESVQLDEASGDWVPRRSHYRAKHSDQTRADIAASRERQKVRDAKSVEDAKGEFAEWEKKRAERKGKNKARQLAAKDMKTESLEHAISMIAEGNRENKNRKNQFVADVGKDEQIKLAKGMRKEHPAMASRLMKTSKPLTNMKGKLRLGRSKLSEALAEAMRPLVEMDLETAKKKAKEESKKGYVQHVDHHGNGVHSVSDWYDSDKTVASYENGRGIGRSLGEEVIAEAKTKDKPAKRVWLKTPKGQRLARRRPSNLPMRAAHAVERASNPIVSEEIVTEARGYADKYKAATAASMKAHAHTKVATMLSTGNAASSIDWHRNSRYHSEAASAHRDAAKLAPTKARMIQHHDEAAKHERIAKNINTNLNR